ncbi:putative LRR receptor-like serine/threonine-protein kinase [Ananas comosus]|uniref:Putative LRR receptor-like serine/threonine-protein kinase n=1 Tax=Ananas comosus TaxID=4615 RepID=A0A199VS21_ANACO|nr:putative LRR receptor-like serine/threonine-protein kinase [Ananas comosus]
MRLRRRDRLFHFVVVVVVAVVAVVLAAEVAAAATAAEKEILLEFKGNVSSDPRGALATWSAGGDPCRDFAGVSCDPSGAVVKIPPQFAALAPTLHKLNLSRNALSGAVPSFLGSFPGLRLLDLSYNASPARSPTSSSAAASRPATSPLHNALSGPVPDPSATAPSSSDSTSPSTTSRRVPAADLRPPGDQLREGGKRRSWCPRARASLYWIECVIGKLVLFSKSLPSKYEDWETGTKALLDKDCIIGGGSIGTVYKASFEGGVTIAVKRLETLGRIRNQDEFEQEMGQLGSLSHPNLVAFQGYYWSSTMQLILSEFIPNGNLYDHLHGNHFPYPSSSSGRGRSELLWSRRFRIALGTARALAYLHHDCKPQILHLNIKSTNILLDEKYEAKLSDYGLGKLLPILGSLQLTKFHTAVGYVAPELASQSLRYSDKCDVYSFGVVLLEIVTGRKPVDSPGAAKVVVLRDYVREVLEDGTPSDCFDGNLSDFVESELIQVLKIGLICTSEAPTRRPSMAEVVQFLESVRNNS